MIVGIGVDICACQRMAAALDRHPGLARKLFTETELTAAGQPPEVTKLAARFAAKEALAKALGVPDGLRWQDCQVVNDAAGQPSFELTGTVALAAQRRSADRIWLSLSHEHDTAIAMVICEKINDESLPSTVGSAGLV